MKRASDLRRRPPPGDALTVALPFASHLAGEGGINIASNHSVDQTVEKLKGVLQAKGVNLFALVDHSGEAEKVGMKMRPTKLLIFGSPKGGTPVIWPLPALPLISRSRF